jgi:hypothetical protein
MVTPQYRFGTKVAEKLLAAELDLPYDDSMQDWAYEVAKSDDLENYLNHYNSLSDEDEKFVLMQLIIQAINDKKGLVELEFYWENVKGLLIKDFKIHQYTIFYWSVFHAENANEEWVISPYMRNISKEISG